MVESLNDAYHFVISSPRSGSTWLTRALNHHPQIFATENRLFGMFCELWPNPNGKCTPRITADRFLRSFSNHSFFEQLGYDSPAGLEEDLVEEFIEFLLNFQHRQSGKPVIVDKVTPYLGTSDQILMSADRFLKRKHSCWIHLLRDGRDVAVSGVFDWVAREKQDSDRFRMFVDHDRRICLTRFFDDELIHRWANYWAEPSQAIQNHSMSVLEIRYESMLADQASTLQSIFEYLGTACDPGLAEKCAAAVTFEKTTGRAIGSEHPLAKTRKGVAGDWKKYFTRKDAELFQQLTGDLLQRHGYEPNADWVEQCPDTLVLSLP